MSGTKTRMLFWIELRGRWLLGLRLLMLTSRLTLRTGTSPNRIARYLFILSFSFFLVAGSILPSYAIAQQSNNYGSPYIFTSTADTTNSAKYSNFTAAVNAARATLIAQSGSGTASCVLTNIIFKDPIPLSGLEAMARIEYEDTPGHFCSIIGVAYVYAKIYSYDVGKNSGGCECDGGNGSEGISPGTPLKSDPINTATGNKYEQETDYSSPSSWLTFRRFYNSSVGIVSTTLGSLWRHSFDRSLQIKTSTSINLFRPDGKFEQFSKTNGIWSSDVDITDKLTEQDDVNGNAVSYSVAVAASRQTEQYSPDGLLLSITDQSGTVTALSYSTASTPASIAPVPNLLLTVTDPKSRMLSFTYSSNGQLQTVIQPDGGVLTYNYDNSDGLTSVQYPDGKTRQYVYNEASLSGGANLLGVLTGVIDEASTRYESTTYDSNGRATSAYQFASDGSHVNQTILVYGNTTNNGTTPVTLTTPLGVTTSLGYQNILGALKVSSSTQPCGLQCNQPWKAQIYDGNGYPSSTTDFNNNVMATTYDANGLLDQQIDASGKTEQRTTNTTWDTTLRVPLTRTVLNASGTTVTSTAWIYNAVGQLLARCEIDPTASYTCATSGTPPTGVRRWTYTYCTAVNTTQCPIVGLLLSVDGPRTDVADVTTYAYYLSDSATSHHGDLQSVTDALGHVTTYLTYDGAGRVTSLLDANGVSTSLGYTPRGWLASHSVGGATTTIGYTPYGAVASITDPDNVTTSYSYDAAHRLTRITDAQGNYVQYTLDAAGNKTQEKIYTTSGSVTHSMSRQFNTLGQLTALVDGLSHTVFSAGYSDSYDANGNLVHNADALGVERKQDYDGLNRLISTLDNYNGSDSATQNTQSAFAYDVRDNLEGVGDPDNLSTIYDYDGLSNLTALQSPDTGNTIFAYDASGNRTKKTDGRGVISTYVYDALNRVISVSYPDNTQNIAYQYDEANSTTGCSGSYALGRLTRVIESVVTTVFCYDARGNVTQKSQVQSSQTDVTKYSYTLANRLSGIVSPNNKTTQYTRDSAGRITAVSVTSSNGFNASTTVVASNITYLPFGPIASYTLGNGQLVTRSYDANYALTDVVSPVLNLHFARDAMGNVTALGNLPGASPATETYHYDALHRLAGVNDASGNPIAAYTYNKTGDRLSKVGSGLATGNYLYASGTHLLDSIGTAARTYDANGNTTGRSDSTGTFGFGYNDRNRMAVVQNNQANVARYSYDAFGQRIAKTLMPQGDTQYYTYDEQEHLLSEHGDAQRDYVWLDDLPIAVADTRLAGGLSFHSVTTVNYVSADGLGAPRVVTDEDGDVIWQWAYQGNPFGEQQPTSTTGYRLNLRYPGQYYDAETGTNYNMFRTYEPSTGRYLQSDPIGLGGGITTYAYSGSNPLTHWDALGLADLFYWKGYNGDWGHVGLRLDDNTTYISWYPVDYNHHFPLGDGLFRHYFSADARPDHSPGDDSDLESHQPSSVIHIDGLDEDAIRKWWDKFKTSHRWNSAFQNCSTTVAEALMAGGIQDRIPGYPAHVIWSPENVVDYVDAYNEFQADPSRHLWMTR